LFGGPLAGEFAVDEALQPGGAGVAAAVASMRARVSSGTGELYYRTSWPVCLGLGCAQLGDLQRNAL
jgi:hypothetical protein